MKVAYSWLKDYIKTDLSPQEMADLLTNTGLEVEGLERFQSVKGALEGLLVGEVLKKEKHPNADKLVVTQVNVGNGELLQIVCGAPNVEAGQKVVVATPGTTIYPIKGDPFKIKKAKIRGESSSGMICAEDEIGLGESHDGIIVLPKDKKPGTELKELYDIYEDWVFEIGLTPNRIDSASHFGAARDIRAVTSLKTQTHAELPDVSAFKPDNTNHTTEVIVEDSHACKRYCGLTLHNIQIKPSPLWMQNRLLSVGLRPINNVVDITNYVLMETGQPLHAFDVDEIEGGKVVVKKLKEGTAFTTLDEVDRKLSSGDLMICNTKNGMCIAGVFGGIKSGVTEKTTKVFLESAYFDPATIRATAKRHGLNTDASFRFERGVDPDMLPYAIKRAALLLKEYAGAEIVSDMTDFYPEKISDYQVMLRYSRLNLLTGITFKKEDVKTILNSLDIRIDSETGDQLNLMVPAYRVDVTREADVIEEVLRIYGYDNVPVPEKLNFSLPDSSKRTDTIEVQKKVAGYLVSNGFNEISNNSLIGEEDVAIQLTANEQAVGIVNPLSNEQNAMRTGLLSGGLRSLAYNINRKHNRLRLFEFGNAYTKQESKYNQQLQLSVLLTGKKNEDTWLGKKEEYSEFYLKSLIENISSIIVESADLKKKHTATNSAYLSIAFTMQLKNNIIAQYGQVKKSVLKSFDIDQPVWFAEINVDELISMVQSKDLKVKAIPKFPEVKRDLSMIINRSVSFEELKYAAIKSDNTLLKNVHIFDVYEGKNIESGKKSYALSFTLQSADKTLTDEEIDAVMNKLMKMYEKDFSAQIRK